MRSWISGFVVMTVLAASGPSRAGTESLTGLVDAARVAGMSVGGAPGDSLDALLERLDRERTGTERARVLRGAPVLLEQDATLFPTGEKMVFDLKVKVVFGDVTIGTATLLTREPVLVNGQTLLHVTNTLQITRFQPGTYVQDIYADPATLRLLISETTETSSTDGTRHYRDVVDHENNRVTRYEDGRDPVTSTIPPTHEISTHAWILFQVRGRGLGPGASHDHAVLGDAVLFHMTINGGTSYQGKPTYKVSSAPNRLSAHVTRDEWRVPLFAETVVERLAQGSRNPEAQNVKMHLKSRTPGTGTRTVAAGGPGSTPGL